MSKQTKDGLVIYDLDPNASELWVVAGPAGFDTSEIDPDNLPEGFRWVSDEEWEELQKCTLAVEDFCSQYQVMAEVDCIDGQYSNIGNSRSTKSLIPNGAESVEIIETDLKGWGYSVHAVVDFGMGHKMSVFAR